MRVSADRCGDGEVSAARRIVGDVVHSRLVTAGCDKMLIIIKLN